MSIFLLSEGVTLHRDDERVDHFVIIASDIDISADLIRDLDRDLNRQGLYLMDPEECEPEHTHDGTKLFLAEMDAGLALDAQYAEAAVA